MIRTLLRVLGPEYAAPTRRTVALMTVAAIAEGLSYALLVPVLTALLGDDPDRAWPWLAGFGAAVAVYAVLKYRSDLSGFRVGTTMLRGMYHGLGDHLARLPVGWFSAARVGEVSVLASRGLLEAMSVVAHLLAPFIAASVTPVTIVVVMLAYHWQLGLAALIGVPIVAAVQAGAGRLLSRADTGRHEHDHDAAARVVEYLQAQPVLRAGGRTGERFAMLDDALDRVRRSSRRTVMAALPGVVALTLAVQVMFTVVLVVGVYLVLGGGVDVATVLAILVLAARCADPLLSLAELGGQLRAARSVLNRLEALLGTPPLPEPQRPVVPERHDLAFEAVSFGHGDHEVLRDLSLRVPQGQRVAVVGPSGAGKSTLLQLLARFYDVDAGAVRVGGVDVRSIGAANLMDQLAIVFQDVYLFDGTIADNVRLGRADATEAQVRAAASAAGLDEVVARLPGGWSAAVGEGGALLSGGERQRVSIARALLKDAPVVLLDEVTSALDPVNEAAVGEGLERLLAGRTVVMVAHRLRTVRRADRVVFVDEGRVVEEGTHEELLERGGRYAALWELSRVSPGGEVEVPS